MKAGEAKERGQLVWKLRAPWKEQVSSWLEWGQELLWWPGAQTGIKARHDGRAEALSGSHSPAGSGLRCPGVMRHGSGTGGRRWARKTVGLQVAEPMARTGIRQGKRELQ